MKKLLLLFFVAPLIGLAQSDLNLHLYPVFNGTDVAFNSTLTHSMGYDFQITRFQYYMGDFDVHHDGGQTTTLNSNDNYLLVNKASSADYIVDNVAFTSVDSIEFKIGVNDPPNHDDPSLYPNGHPLAMQNPDMHWGWAGGYRFFVIEGACDVDGNGSFETGFEIHAIGDELLTLVSPVNISNSEVDGGDLNVYLNYDLADWIDQIDLSTAGVAHGEGTVHVDFMANINTNTVFSERITSVGIAPVESQLNLRISDNLINYTVIKEQAPLRITLTSMEGKTVIDHSVLTNTGTIPFDVPKGIYIVNFLYQDQLISRKIVL